ASKGADDLVDAFGAGNRDEVIDLQYHTDYPGTDPMNENNPDPASTRSGTLGVGQVPYAVMDGGVTPATRYDFSGEEQEPDQDALKLLSLEIPLFEVDLEVDWLDGGLLETTTVTCRTDGFDENIQLYVVVFESSVTAYTGENGDTEFRNVVLGMLPTPAGKLLGNSWYEGKTDTRSNTWTYPDYVEDTDDLGVVAFIQERSTGRILQADVAYKSPQVGIGNGLRNPMNLLIYPNPVQERLFINTETPDSEPGVFRVIDISGKTVMIEEIKPGSQIHTLDVKHLNRGMYIIHWLDSGMPVGRGKFIKTE
ncbi:MAG: T9SS type A sorting domain-containing protein, partial [Bacteroidales bacterium]